MQRTPMAGLFTVLGLMLWLSAGEAARGQDRAGAAMAGAAAQALPDAAVQAPPPPAAGVPPPAGGVLAPPMAGNIGIGAIPVTPPPPIGYYAPARTVDYNVGRFFYYPYYYYPHSYWPKETCQWPERPGQPYMRPPAYMSYPPFIEPHWRHEWYTPQKYYRGFHFWLDQF